MERTVKFRLVEFYRPYTDPLDNTEKRSSRLASHGQKLSSEAGRDTETTFYNVGEDEFKRLDVVFPGWSFSDLELQMMEAGVTDDFTVHETLGDEVRGDTHTSQAFSVGDPDASATSTFGGAGEPHPLTLGELLPWQIEEYMRQEKPSPDVLLEAIDNADGDSGEALAHKIMDAEFTITGGEPREDLVQAIGERFGFSPTGPEGSGGVPGTAPGEDGSASGSGGSGSSSNSGDSPNATEAAIALAKEEGVDLSQVEGTGTGGRVTEPDVRKHLQS